MLDTDMKEANSGRIKIEDVAPLTLERMLDFMYTGKLFPTGQSVTAALIIQLLHCADKYEMDEMKESVLAQMKSSLSTANALEFTQAAQLYGASMRFLDEYMEFLKKLEALVTRYPHLSD